MTAVPVVFALTCVIAGLALLALCVVSFLQYEVSEAIDIVLPIYYGVFGAISLLAEARIRLLFKYLDFMSNRIAKGFFYLLYPLIRHRDSLHAQGLLAELHCDCIYDRSRSGALHLQA